jgi:hypothetical protein
MKSKEMIRILGNYVEIRRKYVRNISPRCFRCLKSCSESELGQSNMQIEDLLEKLPWLAAAQKSLLH